VTLEKEKLTLKEANQSLTEDKRTLKEENKSMKDYNALLETGMEDLEFTFRSVKRKSNEMKKAQDAIKTAHAGRGAGRLDLCLI
jgi:hypothetical protein